MPRKKINRTELLEQTEQTTLSHDTEATTVGDGVELPESGEGPAADVFAESLIPGQEPRDGEEHPLELPDETLKEAQEDLEAEAGAPEEAPEAPPADDAPPANRDEAPPEEPDVASPDNPEGVSPGETGEMPTGRQEHGENWPPDGDAQDFTSDGSFTGPLDIERRLEEELAALDAELAAAAVTERDAVQGPPPETEEAPDEKIEPEEPARQRTPRTRRKAVKDIGQTEQEGESAPETPAPAARGAGKAAGNTTRSPANFYQADFRHLDRDLTEPERQEWNSIYASFRSQSILSGIVAGVDQNELPVKNKDGKVELRVINSLVVIGYRVKILIPENAMWVSGEERGTFLMRGMIGATVDYVVINVDREGEVALASRALALVKRRRAFSGGRTPARPGDVVDCSVLVVGPKRCLVTCGGYDVPMRPSDMSYTSILDMREHYRPGQELKARVLSHHPAQRELRLSVKEATSNPFVGAERRHPVGSRRQAVITSKYKGGVFCTMADGIVCLCLYSNMHYDSEFLLGDNVIIYISQYDYKNQHIYGRIVSKW